MAYMTPYERKIYVETMFSQHPELFSQDHRKSILEEIVTIGMSPYEASLAGGAFAYKVVADKKKWPESSDPLKVMWEQSKQIDDSEIWMTFKNHSQFPDGNEVTFRVYFEHGRAVRVEKLKG
jgi:hypothetical protein